MAETNIDLSIYKSICKAASDVITANCCKGLTKKVLIYDDARFKLIEPPATKSDGVVVMKLDDEMMSNGLSPKEWDRLYLYIWKLYERKVFCRIVPKQ